VSRIPVKKSLYSAEYERFLRLLREAREAAGLTQMQAARKMGRLQSFVSKCESGERRVDIIELGKFCQAYGVRVAQFLKKLDPQL
jgi:transcriptional regulator with XRE-family HTH domain